MRRHRLDMVSLVFGLIFAATGLDLMSDRVRFADLNLGVVWPALLVLLGLAIFASARRHKEH